jgi:peptidoglycan-N-acetylglucosamine deacetylase
MKRAKFLCAVASVTAVGLGLGVAPAVARVHAPLGVQSASFKQDGQQVILTLEMKHAFSPLTMQRDHRTLCVRLRRRNNSVSGAVCIEPSRDHRRTILVYYPITAKGRGRGQYVPSTISRGSTSELTASFVPTEIGVGYRSFKWQIVSAIDPSACHGASDCTVVFPGHPVSARLHVPKLVGCVPSGSDLVFDGPSNVHDIALTFDDGPWPDPPSIDFVNLLAKEHVPATFFEIGEQISEYDPTGSVERTMLADGDMIGDHTWTHPDMVNLSPAAQTSEIEQTAAAIRDATGFTPCLWRPPYEAFDSQVDSLAASLGFLTINYDVDTVDWSLPGTPTIIARAVGGAHNGAIILQHFGGGPRYETYDALPTEIADLRAQGYKFVTITQMLGLKLIYK